MVEHVSSCCDDKGEGEQGRKREIMLEGFLCFLSLFPLSPNAWDSAIKGRTLLTLSGNFCEDTLRCSSMCLGISQSSQIGKR